MSEVKLVEALAVLDILKAAGPGSLTSPEKSRAGPGSKAGECGGEARERTTQTGWHPRLPRRGARAARGQR
jgi:hypothetical protein